MLKIVADSGIPGIADLLAGVGETDLVRGEDMTRQRVRGAQVLLVRSVTRVDRTLLEGTGVRFVGSATAGVDHVDVAFLARTGVEFVHAPGANAPSVVDYVLAAIFRVAAKRRLAVRSLRFGIVGFGNVGSRLAARLHRTGITTLVNDPPLYEASPGFAGNLTVLPLEELLAAVNVVSLHVPLTGKGPSGTHGLIGARELEAMADTTILVNTSRGGVVDGGALRRRIESAAIGPVILDVFENEPTPDPKLVDAAEIATPHIAGYALDSKLEGARVVALAVREFLGCEEDAVSRPDAAPELFTLVPPAADNEVEWADSLIRQMYDIEADSVALKRAVKGAEAGRANLAESFRTLRRSAPVRRAFSRYELDLQFVPEVYRPLASAIGVRLRGEPEPKRHPERSEGSMDVG